MRRFNLTKPAAAGDAGKEAVLEKDALTPPSRIRPLLLILVLVVVVAFGARSFIGRYVGKDIGTSLSVPERVVTLPTSQATRPSPAPTTPVPVVIPEAPAKATVAGERLQTGPEVSSPALDAEDEPSPARTLEAKTPSTPRLARLTPRNRYSIQVGAMAYEANALALTRRLEKLGYRSTIRKGRASIIEHVVLVGTPSNRSEADALAERLKLEGISAAVGELDDGYRVEAGKLMHVDEAIDLARDLQKKGVTTKIAQETVATTLYLVRVGEFMSRSEARQTGQELRQKGFSVLVVKR